MTEGPVVIIDSGLGGLSVAREVRKAMPDLPLVYVADDAAFPYGDRDAKDLTQHVVSVIDRIIVRFAPSAVVIACNTASTLVLAPLRARHDLPFVGTVPAIKPAAEQTRSNVISVLATPATIERDYTRDLVTQFAARCHVRLIGAPMLARLAEDYLQGMPVDRELLWEQVRPCFYEIEGRRTDIVVLACTHFPFLAGLMDEVAPWPVTWFDPAPAIARRLAHVIAGKTFRPQDRNPVVRTSGRPIEGALSKLFADYGFDARETADPV